jgi:acyl transferase domain-containing protein
MASLLKVLLCLKYGELPANIHFSSQNPLVDFTGSPFQVLTHNQPWIPESPRVAGISSFGFGGSNAHVVLSESPKAERSHKPNPRPCLVTLSAKSTASLATMCDHLKTFLETTEADLADIAFTLAVGRDQYPYRLSWIVNRVDDLRAQVSCVDPSQVEPHILRPQISYHTKPTDPESATYSQTLEEWQNAYQKGHLMVWDGLFQGGGYRRIPMPGYVFETKAYWFDQDPVSIPTREVAHA